MAEWWVGGGGRGEGYGRQSEQTEDRSSGRHLTQGRPMDSLKCRKKTNGRIQDL